MAVDDSGAVRGGVRADEVIAQLAAQRTAEDDARNALAYEHGLG